MLFLQDKNRPSSCSADFAAVMAGERVALNGCLLWASVHFSLGACRSCPLAWSEAASRIARQLYHILVASLGCLLIHFIWVPDHHENIVTWLLPVWAKFLLCVFGWTVSASCYPKEKYTA